MLTCPQCNHTFEAKVLRPCLPAPDAVCCEERGRRAHFSWWGHGQPIDLRLATIPLALLVLYVASQYMPAAGVPETLRAFWRAPGGLWERDWQAIMNLALVLVFVAGIGYFLARKLWNKQHVDWDGSKLRAWTEPVPTGRKEISDTEADQLYVSPDGHLRCRLRNGRHVVLAAGSPPALRYVEQQLEERMKIVDIAVADEWLPLHEFEVDVRQCPKCGFDLPSAEIARQVEVVPPPAGVRRSEGGGRLTLSYRWFAPYVFFLVIWLAFWDTACMGFVGVGLATVAHGNLGGLGVFLIPHVWIGVGMTYFVACCFLNSTVVATDGDILRVTCGPLAWPRVRTEIPVRRFDQLYVVQQSGRQTHYTLEARTPHGPVQLLRHQNGSVLRYLEQEIERYLKIVNVDVAQEWKG